MNYNFTTVDEDFEEYCLIIMNLFEELPYTFFINNNFSPSTKTIDNILNYSKNFNQ